MKSAITGSAVAAPAVEQRQDGICSVEGKPHGTCCVVGEVAGLPEPIWNCMSPSDNPIHPSNPTTLEELIATCGENWEPLCCITTVTAGQLSWAESACAPVA